MDKDILKGFKFAFGFFAFFLIVVLSIFGVITAVGFHTPSEIFPGTFNGNYTFNGSYVFNGNSNFNGNYTFNGNYNFTNANITGLSSSGSSWTNTNNNISYTLGNVGIGTASPNTLFQVHSETATGTANKFVFYTYYASTTLGGYSQYSTVDGNTGTVWSTTNTVSAQTGWIAYKLYSPRIITQLKLYPSGTPSLNFKNFAVYGSSDSTNGNDGTWTLITSGLTTANTAQWYTFNIDSNQSYLWYKIQGSTQYYTTNTYYLQIGEIEIYGTGDSKNVLNVLKNGKVGIGTSTPNALLDVAGTIRTNQLCDENGNNCKTISTGWLVKGSTPIYNCAGGPSFATTYVDQWDNTHACGFLGYLVT